MARYLTDESTYSDVRLLSRADKLGVALLLAAFLLFGGMVVYRTALLSRPMGDLGVFLRAAWVVTQDGDLYGFTDDNNWHYCYPPLLAIMLQPLANPPRWADPSGYLPFAVAAGIWYCLNVLLLFVGVHFLAQSLERNAPSLRRLPAGSWCWWALRLGPILVCLPPIGHTLMRGQVNILVLALLCGMIGCVLRGRSVWAGACLGLAITIKVIPAFLLVYPLWRRDGRFVAGCALSLTMGLGLVPLCVFGPARTAELYAGFCRGLLGSNLAHGEDRSRAWEFATTDNQSVQAVVHNALHLKRATRPLQHDAVAVWTSRALAAMLTLVTLLVGSRRGPRTAAATALFPAALMVLMAAFSPLSHLHYISLTLPLIMGLLLDHWQDGAQHLSWPYAAAFLVFIVANSLPHFPGFEVLRDLGLAMLASLGLWALALWRIHRSAASTPLAEAAQPSAPRVAA